MISTVPRYGTVDIIQNPSTYNHFNNQPFDHNAVLHFHIGCPLGNYGRCCTCCHSSVFWFTNMLLLRWKDMLLYGCRCITILLPGESLLAELKMRSVYGVGNENLDFRTGRFGVARYCTVLQTHFCMKIISKCTCHPTYQPIS